MKVVDIPEGVSVLTAALCVPIARPRTAVNTSSSTEPGCPSMIAQVTQNPASRRNTAASANRTRRGHTPTPDFRVARPAAKTSTRKITSGGKWNPAKPLADHVWNVLLPC